MNVLGIPGVDTVLAQPPVQALLERMDREVVVACIRECVAALRQERQASGAAPAPSAETARRLAERVAERLGERERQRPGA